MQSCLLPFEIISLIISYLDVSDSTLAPYAPVSRGWQACVEQRTFAKLNLNNPLQLMEFCQIVVCNEERQKYIQEIQVIIQLELYTIETHAHSKAAAVHSRNNQVFVQIMQNVLRILAILPDNHQGIKLSIQAQSASYPVRGNGQIGLYRYTEPQRRFDRFYLEIPEESLKSLPPVMAVTTLVILGGIGLQQRMRPSAIAVIASKMPRLQDIVLRLGETEKGDQELRKRNRNGKI